MARYDFHLSERDFWDLTPDMFLALLKRHRSRNAEMMAFHAEMKRDPSNRATPFSPEEFMPQSGPRKKVNRMGPEAYQQFKAAFLGA